MNSLMPQFVPSREIRHRNHLRYQKFRRWYNDYSDNIEFTFFFLIVFGLLLVFIIGCFQSHTRNEARMAQLYHYKVGDNVLCDTSVDGDDHGNDPAPCVVTGTSKQRRKITAKYTAGKNKGRYHTFSVTNINP